MRAALTRIRGGLLSTGQRWDAMRGAGSGGGLRTAPRGCLARNTVHDGQPPPHPARRQGMMRVTGEPTQEGANPAHLPAQRLQSASNCGKGRPVVAGAPPRNRPLHHHTGMAACSQEAAPKQSHGTHPPLIINDINGRPLGTVQMGFGGSVGLESRRGRGSREWAAGRGQARETPVARLGSARGPGRRDGRRPQGGKPME